MEVEAAPVRARRAREGLAIGRALATKTSTEHVRGERGQRAAGGDRGVDKVFRDGTALEPGHEGRGGTAVRSATTSASTLERGRPWRELATEPPMKWTTPRSWRTVSTGRRARRRSLSFTAGGQASPYRGRQLEP
jgi:hypothetical protein